MAVRLVMTEAAGAEIEPVLRPLKHSAGSPPPLSERLCIEAVLYQARPGMPWRDLPNDFGHWEAVYNRCRRWEARDIWQRLWQGLQHHHCELAKQVFIDATILRAQQHAAGAPQKMVGNRPRLWAALGGCSTKFHAACTDENTGVCLILTGGERHAAPGFALLWHNWPPLPGLPAAVLDKAYDSAAIRQVLEDQGIAAVIPGKTNRTAEIIV